VPSIGLVPVTSRVRHSDLRADEWHVRIRYVAAHTDDGMSAIYKFNGVVGRPGKAPLLLWSWLLST